MITRAALPSIALAACETWLITCVVALAAWIRLGAGDAYDVLRYEGGIPKALLITGVVQISMYYWDLYDLRVAAEWRELGTRLVQATTTTSFALAAVYFWFPSAMIGRGVFLVAAFLMLPLAFAWRVALERVGDRIGVH